MQMTLRYRIISLVALFAVLLIASFCVLLVTRQLTVITENNQFRARVGTFAVKGGLERTLLSNIRAGDPEKAFQKLIPILQEGQLADQVSVADLKGKVVASSNDYDRGTMLSEDEKAARNRRRKTTAHRTGSSRGSIQKKSHSIHRSRSTTCRSTWRCSIIRWAT